MYLFSPFSRLHTHTKITYYERQKQKVSPLILYSVVSFSSTGTIFALYTVSTSQHTLPAFSSVTTMAHRKTHLMCKIQSSFLPSGQIAPTDFHNKKCERSQLFFAPILFLLFSFFFFPRSPCTVRCMHA